MKSLNSINKRLVRLSDAVGQREPSTNYDRAWLHTLTFDEKGRLFEILFQHNHLATIEDLGNLTQDDLDFLEYVNAKLENCPPSPPVDVSKPTCNICGMQPAFERDGSWPLCEACYKEMVGISYGFNDFETAIVGRHSGIGREDN
jgi:hypothetical protein